MGRHKLGWLMIAALALSLWASVASAQEKEFEVQGYVQMQSGIFVPLTSQLFQDYDNEAYVKIGDNIDKTRPCDPVNDTSSCYPTDHGGKAGKPSMLRGQIQLMAEWRPEQNIVVHATVRLVGSLKLDLDKYSQPPSYADGANKRDYAMEYTWREFYNEADLREFYVDIETTDWLSFRLGRQQVVWGDINSYRLLDVVNPESTTWHFGPLESFEDTRVPLWSAKAMFEMKDIDHFVEFLWVPMLDRKEDTVNTPLTFVGAWGLPYSNTPSPYIIDKKTFLYPGRKFEDMRGGMRWRGNITSMMSYSLMYYYSHLYSPPIPLYYDLKPDDKGFLDPNHMKELFLGFPRQHIAGASFDYTFNAPVSMVAKVEASVEPLRQYPRQSKTTKRVLDTEYGSGKERIYFEKAEKNTINYAVQLMRPSMIRWLNPTQNILMLLQFQHTIITGLSEFDKADLIYVPGYNDYKLQTHQFRVVYVMGTSYLHGMLAPRVVVAWFYPQDAFIATQLDARLGRNWRLRFQITDFFGKDPYKSLGFFRDRDEINLLVRYQF